MLGYPSPRRHAIIAGTGALPRRSRRGYAPSQRQFPTVVSPKHRLCKRRRTGHDPSVAECPTTDGSSVRPHWKQGRVWPDVGITHQALGKYSQRKSLRVHRSLSDSPWPTQHWESESDNGEESRGGHSQETAHRLVTHRFQRCVGLGVCNPATPNSAVAWDSAAVTRRRMSTIRFHKYSGEVTAVDGESSPGIFQAECGGLIIGHQRSVDSQ